MRILSFTSVRESSILTRSWALAPLAAAALGAVALLGGCAAAPAQPGVYVPNPEGTVITFHRVSTGSYGVADGDIAWTQARRELNGKPVMASMGSNGVINYYDPERHMIVGTTDAAGRLAMTFDPPLGYRWPLEVGKTWTDKHQVTLHARNVTVPFEITYRVDAFEPVRVPAGNIQSFRVWSQDTMGETATVWTAPYAGQAIVKRILDRAPSAPQGAGHLEGELKSMKRP